MAREVVTGYCWPQSVGAREQVGLHISSSSGRPVRVEVARLGGRRAVVFRSDAVAAGEHGTPRDAASKGCAWPVALTLDVDPAWRSGYYEVVMEIDVGEKVRRDYAFFVVRPSSPTRIVLALATNTWNAYNGPALYLSVGHDEYWSKGMRDTVESFIAGGGNAGFFSGNTSLWQVRIEGDDHDVMVGYKSFFKDDPLIGTDREAEVTTLWSDVIVGRPENHMTGVSFTRGGYHRIGRNVSAGLGGYTVHRPGHWLFEGTGLGYGDVLGAGATVVGYECDGCVFTFRDGLPYPTGEDGTPSTFEMLGTCPTQHLHPRDSASSSQAGRAQRVGVHRVTGVRNPRSRGYGTDTSWARRAGDIHQPVRRHRRHVRIDRLGPRAGWAGPTDRADHP